MRYCLADFFLLQKKKEITAGLIRENKIAGIACRVAASSNNSINLTLPCVGFFERLKCIL